MVTTRKKTETVAEDQQVKDRKANLKREIAEQGGSKGKGKVSKAETTKSVASKATSSSNSKKLSEGDFLPEAIILTSDEGTSVNLWEESQSRDIVLFFYPKANTPGCTKQACGFRDNHAVLEGRHNVRVFGCSADSPASLANWKKKYNLPYGLLSDKEMVLIKLLGVFRAPKNINRSHVIIGKGGKIVRSRIGVSPAESFEDVVEFFDKSTK